MTNHCLFVVAASPLISDSFPPAAQVRDRSRQNDVDSAQESARTTVTTITTRWSSPAPARLGHVTLRNSAEDVLYELP